MMRALDPFFALAAALRQAGFAVSPDQTTDFIAGVGVLGPRGINDVYAAARALFAIPPERVDEFDAIFRAIFAGQMVQAHADSDEDEIEALEPSDNTTDIEVEDADEPAGEDATASERLTQRAILGTADALRQFETQAARRLPRRLSYRRQQSKHGDRIDLRRALKAAARTDGDLVVLPQSRRKTRQRRIVCLVDVSGSMKDRSDALLGFAHALAQSAGRVEVFTIGTRLTRITTGLALKDRRAALTRVAQAVSDIDGGTRIGDGLQAFLSVPRYAGFVRGALVLVLSDGLERDDPTAMIDAGARMSRMAWQFHWLTPLAADPAFEPKTAALAGVLPWLDGLADGSTAQAISEYVLNIARAA
ncbi:VWA domain-containing protein [Yoonia sp. SS1-5]|uniref:VWA domain-containing protein n=1 Tax=Yoonia rhodophyticola TaxID=3137370 RepID=A0AAN0MCW3_9RHOB